MEKTKNETPEWMKQAKKKAYDARQKYVNKKGAEMGKIHLKRLNEMLGIYFDGWSQDAEENKVAYNALNSEWKKYCNRVNATQDIIDLKISCFEDECKIIIAANPQFQPKSIFDKLTQEKSNT